MLLLDAVATHRARTTGARGSVEHLGDLLEAPFRVRTRVADPLQFETRRVPLPERLEQPLPVGLAQLLPLGQLGLQRPELGRERRRGRRRGGRTGAVRRRVGRQRRAEPATLFLDGAESRLRDEAFVLGPLLEHLPPQGGELLLGLGTGGGDLLEGAALRQCHLAGLVGGLGVRHGRGLELGRGLAPLRRAGRDRHDLLLEDRRCGQLRRGAARDDLVQRLLGRLGVRGSAQRSPLLTVVGGPVFLLSTNKHPKLDSWASTGGFSHR